MTVQDLARQLDRAYAAAADRPAQLRTEAAQMEKSIAHYEGVLESSRPEGDNAGGRWTFRASSRTTPARAGITGSARK